MQGSHLNTAVELSKAVSSIVVKAEKQYSTGKSYGKRRQTNRIKEMCSIECGPLSNAIQLTDIIYK